MELPAQSLSEIYEVQRLTVRQRIAPLPADAPQQEDPAGNCTGSSRGNKTTSTRYRARYRAEGYPPISITRMPITIVRMQDY
ncbi:MAG: hypothetical protein F6K00_07800 [Leptolyngbya sp. SIOISBB]|nr:hypothetical protein [Leptolyngbya sp. SIOISBB]